MLKYTDVVQDTSGNAIAGAVVGVFLPGTATHATLASDINRTALANPMTTGADGTFSFWADPGEYEIDISIPGGGIVQRSFLLDGAYYFVGNASSITGGTTFYLTPGGESATSDDGSFMLNRAGYLTNIRLKSTLAPGAGQTYTYNILKNGVAVATHVLSGASSTEVISTSVFTHVAGDHYRVQLVTSATAATASHRVVLEFV
jgi:hypothetical protein